MQVAVKRIKAKDTYDIRKEELRKNMTLSHIMAGDDDTDSIHLGIAMGDELVCVGSFMKAGNDHFKGVQYQLRGMATHSSHQGQGHAKKLLEEAEKLLRSMQVNVLWCNARTSAVGFYKKMGYQIKGDEFMVDQIGPHFIMYKAL